MWNESVAARGSNGIATFLGHFQESELKKRPDYERIATFSDDCAGQKNQAVMATYIYNHVQALNINK